MFITGENERNSLEHYTMMAALALEEQIATVRHTMEEAYHLVEVTSDERLIYNPNGAEIFFVYFRVGFNIDHYLSENSWLFRKATEESRAICCPSVSTQISNSKIMQYYIQKRRFLDENFRGILDKNDIENLMRLSSEIRTIGEDFKNDKKELMDFLEKNKEAFLMKSQVEGGHSVLSGQDMIDAVQELDAKELKKYQFMKKINSVIDLSLFVRDNGFKLTPSISEMGIFSAFVGENDKIVSEIWSGTILNRIKVIYDSVDLNKGAWEW